MTTQPEAIALADYQAPGYTTQSVDLSFDIKDGYTQVVSRLQVVRQRDDATEIYLDGQELELLSVKVDGEALSENGYQVDADGLRIFSLKESATLEIHTQIYPEKNTALEGLYRSIF